MLSHTSTVDWAGQPSGWPHSLSGILTPVQSATIAVRSDGGRFKTYQRETTMHTTNGAQTRLDQICYNRLQATNFAHPQSRITSLMNRIKGGAK